MAGEQGRDPSTETTEGAAQDGKDSTDREVDSDFASVAISGSGSPGIGAGLLILLALVLLGARLSLIHI